MGDMVSYAIVQHFLSYVLITVARSGHVCSGLSSDTMLDGTPSNPFKYKI
jgi:hypothetical protein